MSKLVCVATADDLQRKLVARMKALKKEAAELRKIVSQSREEIQKLLSSVELEYTTIKDPSDEDFLQIAQKLDWIKSVLVLIVVKSTETSVVKEDVRAGEDDTPHPERTLTSHLKQKLWRIFQYFKAGEKELDGMNEDISSINTQVSQLEASVKNFTGPRKDQFRSYSEKSTELFGLEVKLDSVSFRLGEVFSTLETLKKSQQEEIEKKNAEKNNNKTRGREENMEDQESNIITERKGGQDGSRSTSLTDLVSCMALEDEFPVVEFSSETELEEAHLFRSEDPITEVSPRQTEAPISSSIPSQVQGNVQSASSSLKLREVRKLQIENLENDLGVYSSFSLSPGSYPSTNVFFVEGTPSKFWLSINHPALAEFHNLIKVL